MFIPTSNTKGYATPTPVGMVQVSTPDADGRIVHIVQPYQTLTTIAQAYRVSIDTILALNGLQIDWPLQIDQKLVIDRGSFTPSPTPRPLTPIERLTPESDGKYYHTVKSGETLSWISQYYQIRLSDLMAWNGLDNTSIIRPEQKLVLLVTPPATDTPVPAPATDTPTNTPVPPTPTASLSPTPALGSATAVVESAIADPNTTVRWFVLGGLALGGLLVAVGFWKRKKY